MPHLAHAALSRPQGVWNPSGGKSAPNDCRRGCCWTPLGHSTVVDAYPPTHEKACKCHPKEQS